MEQSPSGEFNIHSASQTICRLLWNQKFHYRVRNSPKPDASSLYLPTLFPQDPF